MEVIQSEQNQWLKKCKALQQKKYRKEYGAFVVEGVRFVSEALEKHADIQVILISEEQLHMMEQWVIPQKVAVYVVKAGLLEKTLSTVHPQGIAAIVSIPQWDWNAIEDMKKIVILDGVQDPGNLGTIIRTALAGNTDGIVCLKGTVDVYNDKVLRATMGAIFSMPLYIIEDHQEMTKKLKQWGFEIVVTDIRATAYYYEVAYTEKVALVVSNEANGPQLITDGDCMIKIPLYNQAESLNVAIATAIVLYEIQRQNDMVEG